MELSGLDSDGKQFKNTEEMWREQIGQEGEPHKKTQWYREGVTYWEGVVRPFLTATGGEAQQDYVTSFRALEDEMDEGIDRLMRELQGVTHVRAVAGLLLENVVDAEEDETGIGGREEEGREEQVRMPQQTGTTSTALPRCAGRESEVVDLINSLFDSFTTAVYGRFDRMKEQLKRVEEKVDKVGEKVVRVEEEVGGVLKAVEVQPGLRRESRKSRFVKSPYTVLTRGIKRKTKKQSEEEAKNEEVKGVAGGSRVVIMEEVEAGGEGSGDVEMEEGGGSGQAKMESTVDLYRPIEEEKKKPFYVYYNESGSDALVKPKTRDYSREWFGEILTMGSSSMRYWH
ncbi:uncharacterized protein LOC116130693 [Pistacia vera]|uniref:uncharacterized protein LOC116130693 n=1 Tax=Pistacia vera TaxID=55513 RepID=UPI001263A416|nr:uncharacterized protein LOC116130693 [Pistacia vera]XP_031272278.1 uncharacterized protein LOC116130693 [Pistacia vera]XP_031272279.1 uncharacterized protein LOC116130693 [Pistacia vera]